MSAPELDRRIRASFCADVDRGALDRWTNLLPRLAETEPLVGRPTRRSRRMPARVLVVAAMLVALCGAVAIAQPGVVGDLFGDSPDAPANQMEVFQQPRDESTPGLAIFGEPASEEDAPGLRGEHAIRMLESLAAHYHDEALPTEYMRSLLRLEGGDFEFELLAIPTKGGKVCTFEILRNSGGGSCAPKFEEDYPARGGWGRARRQSYASGIVSDDVVSVSFERLNGIVEPATMGQNAYLWHAPGKVFLKAMIVEMRDGRTLRFPPAPPLPPSERCKRCGSRTDR